MLEAESIFEANSTIELEPAIPEAVEQGSDLDAESLFSAELAAATLLNRAEEEALAKCVVRARKRIRTVLRRARGLVRRALADAGRGVIRPEEDFREREAVTILHFAEQAQRSASGLRGTSMDRR